MSALRAGSWRDPPRRRHPVRVRRLVEPLAKQAVKIRWLLEAAFTDDVENRQRRRREQAGRTIQPEAVDVFRGCLVQSRPKNAGEMGAGNSGLGDKARQAGTQGKRVILENATGACQPRRGIGGKSRVRMGRALYRTKKHRGDGSQKMADFNAAYSAGQAVFLKPFEGATKDHGTGIGFRVIESYHQGVCPSGKVDIRAKSGHSVEVLPYIRRERDVDIVEEVFRAETDKMPVVGTQKNEMMRVKRYRGPIDAMYGLTRKNEHELVEVVRVLRYFEAACPRAVGRTECGVVRSAGGNRLVTEASNAELPGRGICCGHVRIVEPLVDRVQDTGGDGE